MGFNVECRGCHFSHCWVLRCYAGTHTSSGTTSTTSQPLLACRTANYDREKNPRGRYRCCKHRTTTGVTARSGKVAIQRSEDVESVSKRRSSIEDYGSGRCIDASSSQWREDVHLSTYGGTPSPPHFFNGISDRGSVS